MESGDHAHVAETRWPVGILHEPGAVGTFVVRKDVSESTLWRDPTRSV